MNTVKNTQKSIPPVDYISANEHKLVIWFFKWYTYWLCKRRFSSVWVKCEELPPNETPILFVVNHHSWWDGLTPLLLNEFVFRKRARAIMEDVQMRQYAFFSKIGAMSINRTNVRSALYTLQEAANWLRTPGTCLFLYPEGKITNPHDAIQIEGGVLRIVKQAPDAQVIPIAIYISHQRGNKPELFILTGRQIVLKSDDAPAQLEEIRLAMQKLLNDVRINSLTNEHGYQKLI